MTGRGREGSKRKLLRWEGEGVREGSSERWREGSSEGGFVGGFID